MGRMLQALKNLEARSAWPVAEKNLLGHLAAQAPQESRASAVATLLTLPSSIAIAAPAAPVAHIAPVQPAPLPAAKPLEPPREVPAPAPAAIRTPVAVSAPTERLAPREPTPVERLVKRALSEPHRRQPVQELADRLRQDAQETGSRTLLFVGIGTESAAHEALLHLGALLAEQGGRVLLIDGDCARQSLTLDLECSQKSGLSDLASSTEPAQNFMQPTSFAGLAFLSAGTARHSTFAPAGDRLARVFGELAGDYDLLLIDGGRAGEANAGMLARAADATYVVIQLGAIEASTAQNALRELRAGGARVLGCVAVS